uniref:Uncharacterized protein n=1 Tax=Anguilla anguilla TaxID=7936 RepID=A0A0E9R4W6_ANGAN
MGRLQFDPLCKILLLTQVLSNFCSLLAMKTERFRECAPLSLSMCGTHANVCP